MGFSDFRIDYVGRDAVSYACRRWHYSKTVPACDLVGFGVWEGNAFIGVVVFSRGANPNLARPYGLKPWQVCELTRIALTDHKAPVSKIMSVCLRMIRRKEKNLRLIVSFADTEQGHHGGIYQACGWIYTGAAEGTPKYVLHGEKRHQRSIGAMGFKTSVRWLRQHVDKGVYTLPPSKKHRYLLPLDQAMRAQVIALAKPYPKREKQAMTVTDGTAAGQHRPSRSTNENLDGCGQPLPGVNG